MGRHRSRGFKEVSVVPTHAQHGNERFPRHMRDSHPEPTLEIWRCNLTALSHIHNLYFVGSGSQILIYEPSFPEQKLSNKPVLVLNPSPSTSEPLQFDVLGSNRTINHLLVDFLGNDEIILVALHNGDLKGYYVDQIQHAIERRSEPDCVETEIGDDVHPFFSEHVSRSAWGLAVHCEARMIAVSCNSNDVTVFAFALTKDAMPNSKSWLGQRSEQRRLVTPDTGENIPCVAFCNTGDDPEGRWLLTSDINGFTRIFDLVVCLDTPHESCVEVHGNRYCVLIERSGRMECACYVLDYSQRFHTHATWGVMWLDRRSFKWTGSLEEALGCVYNREKVAQHPECYDCSHSRALVRNSSTVYFPDFDTDDQNKIEEAEPLNEFITAHGFRLRRLPVDTLNGGSANGRSAPKDMPLSPIMRLSVRDIFLLQPNPNGRGRQPVIGFHDPFFQETKDESELESVGTHDIMNFHAQVPELGIAIVGSAKGRVAIMSLTQTETEGRTRRLIYGCRIDHILPFKDQERDEQRPLHPLVGIAVGPVQGMLGHQADRSRRWRWRLLLTYADNSILSYELGKFREERINVREFSGLVV